jgi:pimeloyl-ACP methyl ester carboxylesterase
MSDILLVHGSCHGAWCWTRVLPLLQARGLNARAIDLPAHGQDRTLPEQASLDGYARAILAALTGPTLLVGHSAGGYSITAAAEMDPSRIAGLTYLCAYAPASGLSLADMRHAGPRQPLAAAIRLAENRKSFTIDPDQTAQVFYHDCNDVDRALAAANLCPEPVAPQETALTLTSRSQSLPRFYIRCTEDRTIPPEYQAVMETSVPSDNRYILPTSHSPFFANPTATADLIAEIHARLPA